MASSGLIQDIISPTDACNTNSNSKSLNGSNDFTTYGLTGLAKTSSSSTAWGRTKTFAGLFMKEWMFMTISTVNVLAAVVLTTITLAQVQRDNSSDFTLTIIILTNAVFCAFYVFHGVLKEREFEIYAFIAAALVILIYCIAEYSGNVKGRTNIKLARLIAACTLAPPNIYLAWSVAKDFGFLEFKIVGASQLLQVMYRRAAIFSSLLQFDLQISLSFIILVLKDGVQLNTAETVTLGVGIVYCIMWTALGFIMLYKEYKIAAGVFFFLGLAKPSYILYRIIRTSLVIGSIKLSDRTLAYVMYVAGAINLLLFAVIICELVFIVRNFGHGLRDRVYGADKSETAGLLSGHRSPKRSATASSQRSSE